MACGTLDERDLRTPQSQRRLVQSRLRARELPGMRKARVRRLTAFDPGVVHGLDALERLALAQPRTCDSCKPRECLPRQGREQRSECVACVLQLRCMSLQIARARRITAMECGDGRGERGAQVGKFAPRCDESGEGLLSQLRTFDEDPAQLRELPFALALAPMLRDVRECLCKGGERFVRVLRSCLRVLHAPQDSEVGTESASCRHGMADSWPDH